MAMTSDLSPSARSLAEKINRALNVVGSKQDAVVAILEAGLQEVRDEAAKDAIYHADCRPNRRQAEAAIADAKAINDKWADEVTKVRALENEVAGLQAALQEKDAEIATLKQQLKESWQGIKP